MAHLHDEELEEAEAAVVGDRVEPGVGHCDVGHLRINLGCQCILSRDFPRHLGLDPIDHGVDSEQGDQRHANPRRDKFSTELLAGGTFEF